MLLNARKKINQNQYINQIISKNLVKLYLIEIDFLVISLVSIFPDDTLLLYGKLIDNNNVRIPLPDNWIVPETIYSKSYRNIQCKFKVEKLFGVN